MSEAAAAAGPGVPGAAARPAGAAGESGSRPQRHWPALDGMRAIAVLAVMCGHVGVLSGGYLGVDVFFVLSGFLITALLIAEWDKRSGRIRFRDFYARRVLRLFPALTCVVAAATLMATALQLAADPQQRQFAHLTLSAVPWVLLFSGNFATVHLGVSGSLGALSHTWSLAVEEQFYLLWPALFVVLMRRRLSRQKLALLLGGAAVTEMICRFALGQLGYGDVPLYYSTETRSDGLLIGCALAFWLAGRGGTQPSLLPEKLARSAMWLATAVLCVLFVIGKDADVAIDVTLAVLASAIVVAGVILGHTPPALDRILRARPAVYLGRRSYGFYLWHCVLIGMAEAVLLPITGLFPAAVGPRLVFAATLGLAVTAAFVIADISYRFVELPALRLKRRFSAQAGPGAPVRAAPAPSTVPSEPAAPPRR